MKRNNSSKVLDDPPVEQYTPADGREGYHTRYTHTKNEDGTTTTTQSFLARQLKAGNVFATDDKATYQVGKDGSFRRLDKVGGNKKQRRAVRERARQLAKEVERARAKTAATAEQGGTGDTDAGTPTPTP